MNSQLITKEQIQLFKTIFKGREGVYGEGNGLCTKEPLTDDVIRKHLTGEKRIGVYPLSLDILEGNGTFWIAADLDEDRLDMAIEIREALLGFGIPSYIERSKSKGYHVWIFFTEPVFANKARAVMSYTSEAIGFSYEIFPKQDNLDELPYGSYINLPLFGKDIPNDRTVFSDVDNEYKPYVNQWAFLTSIKKVSPEQLDEIIESQKIKVEEYRIPKEEQTLSGRKDQIDVKESDEEWKHLLPCAQEMMNGVSEGIRNEAAFTLAKHFRADGVPQDYTLKDLLIWNKKNNPPLDESEIKEAVEGAYKGRGGKGYKNLGCNKDLIKQFCDEDCPISVKDKGSAGKYFIGQKFSPKLLADELVDEYHFIYAGEKLHAYQDGFYAQNGEAFAKRKCREKLHFEANIASVNEVVSHISDMTFTETDELNTFINLVNLKNGMLDWRSGELLPHEHRYLSTLRIPVTFNPEAKCPEIDKFLQSSIPEDCIAFIEEWLGYILIPTVNYQKATVILGVGSNGKSVFLNVLEHFVGSQNISKVPLQELDGNRFKRALLFGMLVNLFSDLDATDLQSSSYFKTIVSGDQIDAERKFCDPFSFRPYARLIYSANDFPKSPDKGFAFYRRLVMVPFPNQFLGINADKSLINRLIHPEELSGLLNKALQGLKRLYNNDGFTESESANEALREYKRWNDPIDAFVQDRCEFGDPATCRIERKSFYTAYIRYCEEEGFWRESNQVFYKRIKSYPGVAQVEGNNGTYILTGIKIKSKIKQDIGI